MHSSNAFYLALNKTASLLEKVFSGSDMRWYYECFLLPDVQAVKRKTYVDYILYEALLRFHT